VITLIALLIDKSMLYQTLRKGKAKSLEESKLGWDFDIFISLHNACSHV
jgi:hypothetical protein